MCGVYLLMSHRARNVFPFQKGDRFETECFYDTALSSVGSENVVFGLGSENEMYVCVCVCAHVQAEVSRVAGILHPVEALHPTSSSSRIVYATISFEGV